VARDERGQVLPQTQTETGDGDGKLAGFRTYGKSKDHRDDLPQIVIGMAVTRDGIRSASGVGPATPPIRR